MAVGKQQKKKGKAGKKKAGERFLKKEWWTVRAPGMFTERNFTISPVNQTAGERFAHDQMKGRVYTCSLGDLNQANPHKKIKMVVDAESEPGSKVALTNFYGMDTTRDHLCSLIRKWHTLIDCFVDAKTSDGFLLRIFCTCSTKKAKRQQKATSYAQQSQIKQIRKIMTAYITKEVKRGALKDLVPKLLSDAISEEITKKAKKIFPIQNCLIRKVKTIKRPRFDMTQLLNMQAEQTLAATTTEKKEETTTTA